MNILVVSILGLIGGILAGFFGIGGGIIFVPTLFVFFSKTGLSSSDAMLIATGTSIFSVMLSSGSAALRHKSLKNVRTELLLPVILGLILASICGVLITNIIGGNFLRYIMAAFNIWAICQLIRQIITHEDKPKDKFLPRFCSLSQTPIKFRAILFFLGATIGLQTAMLGIGGGVLSVSFLVIFFKYCAPDAAGTSSFLAFISAAIGIIFRLWLGATVHSAPPFTIGNIAILYALCLGIPAIFGAHIGANLNSRLGESRLFYILFVMLLVLVTLRMII